jgi:cellulose biosynthesis protein BcsQ
VFFVINDIAVMFIIATAGFPIAVSKMVAESVARKDEYDAKRVFETAIPRNIRLAEAPSHGVPIMLHDTKCSGAKAYLSLTEEFLSRQPAKKN